MHGQISRVAAAAAAAAAARSRVHFTCWAVDRKKEKSHFANQIQAQAAGRCLWGHSTVVVATRACLSGSAVAPEPQTAVSCVSFGSSSSPGRRGDGGVSQPSETLFISRSSGLVHVGSSTLKYSVC